MTHYCNGCGVYTWLDPYTDMCEECTAAWHVARQLRTARSVERRKGAKGTGSVDAVSAREEETQSGSVLSGGDPMGRFPALPGRTAGVSLWAVYDGRTRVAGGRQLSRLKFARLALFPVIALWLVLVVLAAVLLS